MTGSVSEDARPDRERLLTRGSARARDKQLIDAGVPSVVLMENAGRGAAEGIASLARARGISRAVVLAGPGNNGGDGLVVARHLVLAGLTVELWAVDPTLFAGDARLMRDAWLAIGGTVRALPSEFADDAAWRAVESDLVIDALFGTGLSRPLGGAALTAVRRANARADRPLSIALDIPSGLDVDTGAALGTDDMAFRATHTFTFGASKLGLHTGLGARVAGRVSVVSLGAPVPPQPAVDACTVELVRRVRVPPRRIDAHKGDNGHALVIGGSAGKTGAALLSARGAHRGGAGLVSIASRSIASIEPRVMETMTLALPDDAWAALAALQPMWARTDAVLAGPGLGQDEWASAIVQAALDQARRLVLDADALSLLPSLDRAKSKAVCVLTPHPLEMARLLGQEGAASVNADRIPAARACAFKYKSYIVLKGAGSIVSSPDGRCAIVDCAEPALGVAGSGDVLAGVLAARLAERGDDDVFERVLSAVVAHGRAGAMLRDQRGASRGLLATEIADAVSAVMER